MIEAPCRKCTTETGRCADPNCHAYCEKYLEYKDKYEEEKKVIKLGKERTEYVTYDKLQRSRGFMLFSQV